jgi:hypothetical protein
MDLGVIADLILFTPYDYGHWGFDCMGQDQDLEYVRYAVARLSSFRNVWWALANEWSDNLCKCGLGEFRKNCSQTAWDVLGEALAAADPYGRQKSIHNGEAYYNHSRGWVSHISMQCHHASCADLARNAWPGKPIVFDEVGYEGKGIGFANLGAQLMTGRVWVFLARGTFAGHSEALLPTDAATQKACTHDGSSTGQGGSWLGCDVEMWWNRGGRFHGGSAGALSHLYRWITDRSTINFPLKLFGSKSMRPLTLASGVYVLGFPGRFYLVVEDELDPAFKGKVPSAFTLALPKSVGINGSYSCFALQYFDGTITPCGEDGAFDSDCQSVLAPGNVTCKPQSFGVVYVFTVLEDEVEVAGVVGQASGRAGSSLALPGQTGQFARS